jgi:hypothetical protein
MDVVEQRIREVVATLLSSGAKALERTANELERAASGLRPEHYERADHERVWSERTDEPETVTRRAPLRAVPDTPTDEAPEEEAAEDATAEAPWTPPAEPPTTPERERPGDVDAAVTTSTTVAGPPEEDVTARAGSDRMQQIAAGTVAEVRAQLPDLSAEELHALRKAEVANRNRTTLIASIDRAIADAE